MTDDELLAVVHEAVDAVVASFDGHDDWGLSGGRDGITATWWLIQPLCRCFRMLACCAEEESGRSSDAELVAVVDPLDIDERISTAAVVRDEHLWVEGTGPGWRWCTITLPVCGGTPSPGEARVDGAIASPSAGAAR